jgi:hypothetical protein
LEKIYSISSSQIPNHKIFLYACQPNFQGKKVRVLPTDPVYILNPIFPGEKKVYFHNGEAINPTSTFLECKIVNGDRVVTVPIEQMNCDTLRFWKKATANISSDHNKILPSYDAKLRGIFSKLKDNEFLKGESGFKMTTNTYQLI